MSVQQSFQPPPSCFECPVRRYGIFSDLPPAQVSELEASKTLDQYDSGHILFYQGHHPLAVYCVLAGHIKLYHTSPTGERHILRIAGPGDLIGDEALLSHQVYGASAEAMEPCHVCILPAGRLLGVLQQNPPLLVKLIQKLEEELAQSRRERDDIIRKPVRARMAHLLLDFRKRVGRSVRGKIRLKLHLSRAEMADMIGTTPETAIRVLNRLKRDRLITLPAAQTIEIVNEPGLKTAAALTVDDDGEIPPE